MLLCPPPPPPVAGSQLWQGLQMEISKICLVPSSSSTMDPPSRDAGSPKCPQRRRRGGGEEEEEEEEEARLPECTRLL